MTNKSPNYSKRTRQPIGYIIHGTLGKYEGAIDWLCTPPEKRPVVSYSSAHYVVANDGRYIQLIDEKDVSWHAGNISNPTQRAKDVLPILNGKFLNPNESFIGIELEWLSTSDAITDSQYKVVVDIIKNSGIVNPIILTHKDVADYKSDFPSSFRVVEEITRRLGINPAPQAPVVSKDVLSPLLTKLNAQMANKDYKGAKDTTSYLFNELTKIQ